MTKPLPRNVQSAVLVWLSDLAQRGAGYEIRGQRGWASPRDAAAAIGRSAKEELVKLAGAGKLDRVNISLAIADGPRSGTWLYRINASGAAAEGMPAPRALGPPTEGEGSPRAIFTDAQWLALEVLRKEKLGGARLRFAQRGWMTTHEIRAAGLSSKDVVIQAEDVYVLARAGLVERQRSNQVEGIRQIHFYRSTALGDTVERLTRTRPTT